MSDPAPAADNHDADLQTVKNIEAARMQDPRSKDLEKWIGYFAENASGLYPGTRIADGKAALKEAVAPFFTDPNFAEMPQSTRMMASKGGDMVYSRGTYMLTMTNSKTHKPMTDTGKYLTIYMKQPDGSWKIVADTYNSDSPL